MASARIADAHAQPEPTCGPKSQSEDGPGPDASGPPPEPGANIFDLLTPDELEDIDIVCWDYARECQDFPDTPAKTVKALEWDILQSSVHEVPKRKHIIAALPKLTDAQFQQFQKLIEWGTDAANHLARTLQCSAFGVRMETTV